MDLELKLAELAKTAQQHREVLLTEEAAKTALVMPFLQALGYNVFNPAEVVPEFTADVGIKKGEKVDYAICIDGKVEMLVECKPAGVALDVSHAAQLFRYFGVTETRVALLTNGLVYKFFSDTVKPNRMDDQPFFTFELDAIRKQDVMTLARFTRHAFSVDRIVELAAMLKNELLVYQALADEFAKPSDQFVRMIATRISAGRLTVAVRDGIRALITASVANLIRDRVTERLTSALTVADPVGRETTEAPVDAGGPVVTTQDEIDGFQIVRAIASRLVNPTRIVMRDAQTYCAILLDDNNRRPIVRLRFNSPTARYLGLFSGKDEVREKVSGPVDIYRHDAAILKRVTELLAGSAPG